MAAPTKAPARKSASRSRARPGRAASPRAVRAAPEPTQEDEHESHPVDNIVRRVGRPDTARIQRAEPREEIRTEERSTAPGQRMQRSRRRTEDVFRIDRKIIPQGMSYEWKRVAVKGRAESSHQVNLRENGWTPVPTSRHPELMPDGHTGPIQKDEMLLMERPSYLTEEARQEDYELARDQVRIKEAAIRDTPAGTFSRDHPSAQRNTGIRKSYEPMSIPD